MALGVAENFLREKAVAQISARQIAAEMGYTVGTLYTLFENQSDLFLHVNSRAMDVIHQVCSQSVKPGRDATKNIAAIGVAYLEYATTHPFLWESVFTHKMADGKAVPDWYQKKIDNMFQLVEEQLALLPTSGTRKDRALAARVLWGGVHGITVLSLGGKLFAEQHGQNADKKMVTSLVENYLLGWNHQQ